MQDIDRIVDVTCVSYITDISLLRLLLHSPPSKAVRSTPQIYPGSTLYREEVYGQL